MTLAVAGQAAGTSLLAGMILEDEYLGFVAATGDVICARTMAALATLLRGATFFVQSGFPVRSFFPGVVDFLMTGLTRFRAHVLGDFGGGNGGRGCAGGLGVLGRDWRTGLACHQYERDKRKKKSEQEQEMGGPGSTRRDHVSPWLLPTITFRELFSTVGLEETVQN